MGVDHPSQDLLGRCLVPVPGQFFIQAGGLLHIDRKGGEDILEGAYGEIGDPLLLGGVYLSIKKEVVHTDVYVFETFGRVCCAIGGLVRPARGGGDYKGGDGLHGVAIGIINDHLGYGTEEVG